MTLRNLRALRALAVVGTLCLVPLACGGDDDDDPLTEAAQDDGSDGAGDSGGDGEGGDVQEWCTQYDALEGIDFDFAGASTPAEAEATITSINDGLDGLLDTSPDDIRGDVETLAGFFDQLRDAAEANDYDLAPVATDADLEAAFTSGEFDKAGTNVDAYYEANCS